MVFPIKIVDVIVTCTINTFEEVVTILNILYFIFCIFNNIDVI